MLKWEEASRLINSARNLSSLGHAADHMNTSRDMLDKIDLANDIVFAGRSDSVDEPLVSSSLLPLLRVEEVVQAIRGDELDGGESEVMPSGLLRLARIEEVVQAIRGPNEGAR